MSSQKSRKRKRTRKRKQDRFGGLKRKLEQGPFRGATLVLEPGGEVKMSEVLAAFVEPYLHVATTEEAYRKLLTLALIAWNTSLLPAQEQETTINRVLDEGIPGGADDLKAGLKEIVNMLIERKRVSFAEYRRMIIDFELTDTGEGYHLTVASTLEGTR